MMVWKWWYFPKTPGNPGSYIETPNTPGSSQTFPTSSHVSERPSGATWARPVPTETPGVASTWCISTELFLFLGFRKKTVGFPQGLMKKNVLGSGLISIFEGIYCKNKTVKYLNMQKNFWLYVTCSYESFWLGPHAPCEQPFKIVVTFHYTWLGTGCPWYLVNGLYSLYK